MYIVYAKNQFTLLGKEYFGTDEKIIIGFHDPRKASHFDSIEDAKEFCKLFDYEDRKIEPVTKHIKAFEKCNYVYRKIAMLDKSMDIKYDGKKHDAIAVLDWRIKHAKASEKAVSFENYRTWPDLYSVFTYLHSLTKYNSRDYKSLFYSVQLKTPKNGNYKEFYKELRLVLDYCTFIDEDGRKIFDIFDHELCEYERRSLRFGGDQNCTINNGRCDMFEGTLEECFNLMKREYWYE
jgi:hypothetical protein